MGNLLSMMLRDPLQARSMPVSGSRCSWWKWSLYLYSLIHRKVWLPPFSSLSVSVKDFSAIIATIRGPRETGVSIFPSKPEGELLAYEVLQTSKWGPTVQEGLENSVNLVWFFFLARSRLDFRERQNGVKLWCSKIFGTICAGPSGSWWCDDPRCWRKKNLEMRMAWSTEKFKNKAAWMRNNNWEDF